MSVPVDRALPPATESAHALQMSRTDGCPECVVNVEEPLRITPTADGFRAEYKCADCGHAWTTSWRDE